jgi:hypothetical protein
MQYISLDPTAPDQFIAIRSDGAWAGSINDTNEDALSAFALSFFHLVKPRSKAKAKPQTNSQPDGVSNPSQATPDPATQALYERWATSTATSLASALAATNVDKRTPKKLQIRSPSRTSIPTTSSASIPISANSVPQGRLLTAFPYLPTNVTICRMSTCTSLKADTEGLRACKHDVERLLRASGLYSYEWLRQERLRWHPDRFGRLCEEEWREEGKRLAEEMFKTIDILMGELRELE